MSPPVDQRDIRIPGGDGRMMSAVVTLPGDGPAPRPGLVLIYEIFGLREDIRAVARRFADHGYASIIPDLFDRPEPRPLCILRAARSMARRAGREFGDLHAAREYLAALPPVDGSRIGVVGFCFGGGFAVALAPSGDYRVSAPFYGRVPHDRDALAGACPVVASFGGRDVPLRGAGQRLAEHLSQLGVPHDVKVYPEAGHAFMTPKSGFMEQVVLPLTPMHAAYHEASAEDAWLRMLAFLAQYLGAADAQDSAS